MNTIKSENRPAPATQEDTSLGQQTRVVEVQDTGVGAVDEARLAQRFGDFSICQFRPSRPAPRPPIALKPPTLAVRDHLRAAILVQNAARAHMVRYGMQSKELPIGICVHKEQGTVELIFEVERKDFGVKF